MADPYIGEIRLFAGNYAPVGWALCHGQLYPISENEALFQLIGTRYGGDGQETFAVPDLQSRVPVHMGALPYSIGSFGGVESVTLTSQQIPVHNHALLASRAGGQSASPQDRVLASPPGVTAFIQDAPSVALPPGTLSPAGGSQPHDNLMPYGCVTYIISLFGIFPSPT
jgi:microcystin-dependent protein